MADEDRPSKTDTSPTTSLRRRSEPERLRDLLLGWLAAKKASTQATYRTDLEDFAAFMDAPNMDTALQQLWALPVPHANALVLDYRTEMLRRPVWRTRADRDAGKEPERTGLHPKTINRRLSALRSITELAQAAGMFRGQLKIKGLKIGKAYRDTRGPGKRAYHDLLGYLEAEIAECRDNPPAGYDWARLGLALRDRAMVRLFHDVGLRRIEVVRLNMADVLAERCALVVEAKGEGDTRIELDVGRRAWLALMEWVEFRGRQAGPLFHGLGRDTRMDPSTINKSLRRREQEGKRIWPHGFRHTGATTVAERTNGNIIAVQQWARHSDPNVSKIYVDNLDDGARKLQDLIAEPDDEGE